MAKQKRKIEPIAKVSADLLAENKARLGELFPEVVTEGKVDFVKLQATLGQEVDDRPERYRFTWAGKRDAMRLLQVPSRATLIPVKKGSVNFEETANIFIEGDNLEVLKLLYKPYFGRVKMIYIDPPYNTGNDFIYPDNFTDPLDTYLRLTGQKNAEGNLLTSNPETSGRYHSAWLSMMYPRLFLARQLLREDGVIFVSIDDHEVHNLRMLMNEVFGEENLVAQIIWEKVYSPRMDAKGFSSDHDYIMVFRRSEAFTPARLFFEQNLKQFTGTDSKTGKKYRPRSLRKEGKNSRREDRPHLFYPLDAPDGSKVLPVRSDGSEGCWRWSRPRYETALSKNLIEWIKTADGWQVYVRQFYDENATKPPGTIWPHTEVGHNHEAVDELKAVLGEAVFENPKPTRLIKRMLQVGTESEDEDNIILDFFAGSCATADAILQLNQEDGGDRRFIVVQLPEPTPDDSIARKAGYKTIAEIGKERIRRVTAKMKKESGGKLDFKDSTLPEDLGLKVFKLAESNYKPWTGVEEKSPGAYAKTMELFTDPLLPNWKLENVIWEVAIKEGYGLNARIESVAGLKGSNVYRVTDPDKNQLFYITLEEELKPSMLKMLSLGKDDLFICLDKALNDETAANLALQCRLKTI
jgi:adenine-specific DNA-methyltransferase